LGYQGGGYISRKRMKHVLSVMMVIVLSATAAVSATITNSDAEPASLAVSEGGNRFDVVIAPGASEQVCASNCFVTFPNGDRIALEGTENVEIVKGSAVVK
jgi:hypothetical protein